MSNDKKDYNVGYGKPPKQHQFKKGQSGNPAGRPKKPEPIDQPFKNTQFQYAFLNDAEQILNLKIDGEVVPMRKIEAIVAQLGNKALKGDNTSAKLYLQYHGAISADHDEKLQELRDTLYDMDAKRARELEAMPFCEIIANLNKRWRYRKWCRDRGEVIPFECEEPCDDQDWAAWEEYCAKVQAEDPSPGQWPPAYWDDEE